jgi:signal transduction histidine kinase
MMVAAHEIKLEKGGAEQPQDSIRHVQIKILAREITPPQNPPSISTPGIQQTKKRHRFRQHSRPAGTALASKSSASLDSKSVPAPKQTPAANPSKQVESPQTSKPVKPANTTEGISSLVYKSLAASVALLLAGLAYLVWLYRRKSQLHNQLAAQNEEMKYETAIKERQTRSLEELNELKDKLFAIVSHDLRSPIGNLKAIMEMFQHEGMSVEQISEMLTEMVPSVENADMIISNLLNWAVNQRGGLKLKKTSLCYCTMIDETVRSFTYLLNAKKISVENIVRANTCVFADMDQVRIILRNLVSNAVKFVPIGGRIRFYTEECEDGVVLAVEDNGKGLTGEEIHRLFESNIHLSKEGTKGEKGAGIGLMLCREMANLNDGKIYVESVPGQSCTFYLKLPKSEVPELIC